MGMPWRAHIPSAHIIVVETDPAYLPHVLSKSVVEISVIHQQAAE